MRHGHRQLGCGRLGCTWLGRMGLAGLWSVSRLWGPTDLAARVLVAGVAAMGWNASGGGRGSWLARWGALGVVGAAGILAFPGPGVAVGQDRTVARELASDDSAADDSAADDTAAAALAKEWEDYLVSPIRDAERQWALDAMTAAERKEMDEVLGKTSWPLDAVAAQVYIKRLCEMGPRISGSKSMKVQQSALVRFFSDLGCSVATQKFDVPHPETRTNVTLVNTIVQLHPERRRRILICCHYDTRPYADRDPVNPQASMDGANDGASGVGLLMVMAPHLREMGPRLGIDLVFFDAEELIYVRERDRLFLGSTYFAEQYVRSPPEHRYVAGVLIDMIADRTLELYHEKNSLRYAGPLTKQIWNKAAKLGIKDFVAKPLHEVRDDHLPLNEIAKIPTTDLIDFDYPSIGAGYSYWHTTQDTVDKCSPLSMAKVGVVLLEWAKDYTR